MRRKPKCELHNASIQHGTANLEAMPHAQPVQFDERRTRQIDLEIRVLNALQQARRWQAPERRRDSFKHRAGSRILVSIAAQERPDSGGLQKAQVRVIRFLRRTGEVVEKRSKAEWPGKRRGSRPDAG